jgi:hypothetical protein
MTVIGANRVSERMLRCAGLPSGRCAFAFGRQTPATASGTAIPRRRAAATIVLISR